MNRQQQSMLIEIDGNLNKLRMCKDLSYAEGSGMSLDGVDLSKFDEHRVDDDTLQRLIDECREEESRMSVFEYGQTPHEKIQRQKEMSDIQLEQFDLIGR